MEEFTTFLKKKLHIEYSMLLCTNLDYYQISYQLRKQWQQKNHPAYYQGHIAEIDAHAFAYVTMLKVLHVTPTLSWVNKRCRKEIKERSYELNKWYI